MSKRKRSDSSKLPSLKEAGLENIFNEHEDQIEKKKKEDEEKERKRKEDKKAYDKKWYQDNRESIKAKRRKRYHDNRDSILEEYFKRKCWEEESKRKMSIDYIINHENSDDEDIQ